MPLPSSDLAARARHHLRLARETNPMNDWFLARMVTVVTVYAWFLLLLIKT